METVYALAGLTIEIGVLHAVLFGMHAARGRWSGIPFHMLVGALVMTLYGLAYAGAVLRAPGLPPLALSSTVILPTILTAALVTYACEGTRAARALIAMIVSLSLFFAVVQATVNLQIPAPPGGAPDPLPRGLFTVRPDLLAGSVGAFALDLFAIVILYQFFANWVPRAPATVRTTLTFALVLVLDACVYYAALAEPQLADRLTGQLMLRPVIALLVGLAVAFYVGAQGGAGGQRGTFAILAGVGALEESLRRARERERLFRRFFDISADGMIVLDRDLRVLEHNVAAAQLAGISPQALAGASLLDLLREWCGEERTAQAIRECDRRGTSMLEATFRRAVDTAPVTLLVRLACLDGAGSGRARWLATLIDDTERRSLEATLAHAQKMSAIGALAGGVAHDFNNLLLAIVGSTSLLERRFDADTREGKLIRLVSTAAARARELTKSLLAMSRRTPPQPRPIEPNAVVAETVELFSRSVEKRKEIRVLPADAPPLVRADPGQVQQALLNVLINARDAISDTGTIEVATRVVEIDAAQVARLGGVQPGRYVAFEVSDTGAGIPPKARARIFEPFYTTKPSGQGTGLGLSITYGIVRGHGGAIDLESEVGKGTRVRLYFPAPAEAVEPPAPEGASGGERAGGGGGAGERELVLIIDDEPAARDLEARMLEELGYRAVTAATGLAGVEAYRERQGEVALVLLDLDLPDIDGVEVARRIRAEAPGARIVVVSGYGSRGGDVAAMGALGFLQKPFQYDEFGNAIKEALAHGEPAGGRAAPVAPPS